MLPGSAEVDGNVLRAGVHTGNSEWDIQNLRYIEVPTSEMREGENVGQFLGRIYEDSTGCLVKHDFKRN